VGTRPAKSFDAVREILMKEPVLRAPDFSKPFVVATDASEYAIGAVISQFFEDDLEHPVGYWSHTLTAEQRRWEPTKREAYAVFKALRQFSVFIRGDKKHILYTDHKPLLGLFAKANTFDELHRWATEIATYPIRIHHRPGKLHGNADGTSREPFAKKPTVREPSGISVEFGNLRFVNVSREDLEELQLLSNSDLHRAPGTQVFSIKSAKADKKSAKRPRWSDDIKVDSKYDVFDLEVGEKDFELSAWPVESFDEFDVFATKPLFQKKADSQLTDKEVAEALRQHN
jgi:hypothetical protein